MKTLAVNVGSFTVDIIAYDLPRIARPGEIVYVEGPINLHVGGHAVNVSIDLVKLGRVTNVAAVGAAGDDVFAKIIKDELSRYGIKVYTQVVKEVGTARNVILVVKGEDRRFYVEIDSSNYLSPKNNRIGLNKSLNYSI